MSKLYELYLNLKKQNESVLELLTFINKIDVDNLSVVEAYNTLETLKKKTTNITEL